MREKLCTGASRGIPASAAWSETIFLNGFEPGPTVNGSGQTPESTVVIENAAQSGVQLTLSPSGDLMIDAPAAGAGGQFQVGRTVQILPGNDPAIPLGLTGEIEASGVIGGSATALLTPSTLADVFDIVEASQSTIPLTAENFIGVIAPAAVRPSANARKRMQSGLDGTVALDGGLWLTSKASRDAGRKGGSNIDVTAGDIELDLEITLADIINDPDRIHPYGSAQEAVVGLQLSLRDIRLTTSVDFDAISLGGPRLNSFSLSVDATLQGQLALSGGVQATMGYYSQAWNEVESTGFSNFKLKGLDSNDKIGRYPIAGLVFSLPCPPPGCPITPGATQTPLRAAQAGGVILWVYANLDGTLTLDGSVGARLSATRTIFSASKPNGGELGFTSSAQPVQPPLSPSQLEAPFVEGELALSGRAGFALDADLFLLGVRIANVATDIGFGIGASVHGTLAYATPSLSTPMAWSGAACVDGSFGGGAIFSGRFGIGIEVPTPWPSVGLNYSIQIPAEEDILQPGLHGLWYTGQGGSFCFPAPFITSVSLSRNHSVVTVDVSGSGLPGDLEMAVAPLDACTGPTRVASSLAAATFTCMRSDPSEAPAQLTFTSASSSNLGGQSSPTVNLPGSGPDFGVGENWNHYVSDFSYINNTNWIINIESRLSECNGLPDINSAQISIRRWNGDTWFFLSEGTGGCTSLYEFDLFGFDISMPGIYAMFMRSPFPGVGSLDQTNADGYIYFESTGTGIVLGAATPPPVAVLNDTGISWCADATTNNLTCPQAAYPDQDGDHGRDALARAGQLTKIGGGDAGFDYTKISNGGNALPAGAALGTGANDWGCTRDNLTGLIWEVKANNATSLRHTEHSYTWYDTNSAINGNNAGTPGTSVTCNSTLPECNTSALVAAVNAQGLCGANDWRMPTPEELQGIVHYGRSNFYIDPGYFPNTSTGGIWSGRNYAGWDSQAWGVYLDDGSVRYINKNGGYKVWLVRDGQ